MKRIAKKVQIFILSSILLSGCAHNNTGNFHLLAFTPEKNHRTPAATQTPPALYDGKSTKEVYFLALLRQTQYFYQLANNKEFKLNSCPAFHSLLITESAKIYPTGESIPGARHIAKQIQQVHTLPYNDQTLAAIYPAITFSSAKHISTPHLQQKLQSFNQRNIKELSTLCETGSSDHYYTFDNLIRYHHSDSEFHHSPQALVSVTKMPIIANGIFLESLRSDQPTEFLASTRMIMHKTNTTWLTEYVRKLRSFTARAYRQQRKSRKISLNP